MTVFEYENKVVYNERLPLNYSQEDKLTSVSVWLIILKNDCSSAQTEVKY